MIELFREVKAHLRADFRADLYGATALFLSLLITVNYWLNLEDSYIDADPTNPWRSVWYVGLYATAYYGAVWLWTHFHKKPELWRQGRFWRHTLVGLVVYSVYAGFYGYAHWSEQLVNGQIYTYAFKCLSNLQSVLTIVLPLLLYYWLIDKPQNGFYGLRPKRKGLLVYAGLLALMAPLIIWASYQPDFLQAYPTYRDTNADEFFGVAPWVTALVYELCYGWDFVPTELLFRGFLVIGLSRVLGRGAVLPMVVWYCTIHFGRPLGEAISSVFGGYILGVLALNTRSIWGGMLIHIGIAWGMDAAAFWQGGVSG